MMMAPAGSKILTVEDEGIVAANLKVSLQNLGYHFVTNVRSGEEAIEQVKQTHPDLVLMDIVLDGQMDGIEAAKKIELNYGVPVVYLTAYSDKEILERATPTNHYGYIVKPFEERNLGVTLEMAIYKHKYDNELRDYRNMLSAILTRIPNPVLVCDSNGHVKYFNMENQISIGKSLIGLPLKEVLKVKIKNHELENIVAKTIEEDKIIYRGNAYWDHPNGKIPVGVYCAPLERISLPGEPKHAVVVLELINPSKVEKDDDDS